jgi:biotin transport system substrate-specific component
MRVSHNQGLNLRKTVYTALFTALIIVGGYISFPIPLNPVPIVLSDFFVMLAGLFLGASWGLTAVGLFLLLGALGLPVFAGGASGLADLLGPRGGFLIGFFVSAGIIGYISNKGRVTLFKDMLALITGNIILYACGVPWLKWVLKISWVKAVGLGLVPFIPGIVIKVAAAAILIRILRPLLKLNTYYSGS